MPGIVADTSAFVAIFKNEPDSDRLTLALASSEVVVVPASCLVEAALLRSVGRGFFGWFEQIIDDRRFEVNEISASLARSAAQAARTYGKGSGHPAQLNFGDCLVYAVARHRDLPLLFIGGDFRHTDIAPALA